MATYKVLQDIEAEDKLIGPLTLRQCIYAAIAAVAGYATFLSVTKGAAFLAVFFVPFVLVGGFFAFPWSRQQPTEVWALAKLRFLVKPRKRIWDQSGVKELVTITAPKRLEHIYSSGLSQTEVQNRLRALADTIDTRGWAVKNVGLGSYAQPNGTIVHYSDRLVAAHDLPQEVPTIDSSGEVDMLDLDASPVARQLDSMLSASATAHRQKVVTDMNQSVLPAPIGAGGLPGAASPSSGGQTQAPPADYWFMNQPGGSATAHSAAPMIPIPVPATPTAAEEAFAQNLKAHRSSEPPIPYAHLRTIQPLDNLAGQPMAAMPTAQQAQGQADPVPATNPGTPMGQAFQPAQAAPASAPGVAAIANVPAAPQTSQPPVTTPPTPATLELANNNDLSVAAIAHEAGRLNDPNGGSQDEVTVSLH